MNLPRFTSAFIATLLLSTTVGAALPVAAAPGSALQQARTNARIRQGQGEDIILNSRGVETAPTLVATIVSDTPMMAEETESYPGQALREARSFSRLRRGVGEDIR
jgi:hypothetical protein